MKFVVGIQARDNSTRLPGKVMFPLGNTTVLGMVMDKADKTGHEWCVLTDKDSPLVSNYAPQVLMRDGPVSHRFLEYARRANADYIVRLCGDQPFVKLDYILELIELAENTEAEYCGYIVDDVPAAVTSYGIYPEVVQVQALRRAEPSDHVTQPIYSRPDLFRCEWIYDDPLDDMPSLGYSLCVDTLRDYYRIKRWWENDGGWPSDPMGYPHKNYKRYKAWL
jgi:spore coat polysaccharide biosynthesis protein SpsF